MRWLRKNWKKALIFTTLGYIAHIFVEALIVTNILAIFGKTVPIFI